MQDFRNLKVWQKAHALTLKVYHVTNAFPQHQNFGLRSQLRRDAMLIPCKIAEGCGKVVMRKPTGPSRRRSHMPARWNTYSFSLAI